MNAAATEAARENEMFKLLILTTIPGGVLYTALSLFASSVGL